VPSEKRARQRAAREAKRQAQAKAARRRSLLRNSVIVVVIAAVVVGSVLYFSRGKSPTQKTSDKSTTTVPASTTTVPASTTTTAATPNAATYATEQKQANATAVAAGCPASPTTRVNTLHWSSPPPMTISTSKSYRATVKTTVGTFLITLFAKQAPVTVNSFVFLAKHNYFHCVIFHRVIPGFMDQTGDPTGTGTGGPGYQFANENVPKAYATGDVAMANSGPNTNGSQFFVLVPGGAPTLDQDLASGGYSLFGKVISGMTVVEKINSEGNSSDNGTPPKVIQRMLSVTIST
jgi:cyclophilin family peptidyl-prolyl cis-trans isomerase